MSVEDNNGSVGEAQQEAFRASEIVNPEVPFFGGAVIMRHVPYAGEPPPAPEVKPEIIDPNHPA